MLLVGVRYAPALRYALLPFEISSGSGSRCRLARSWEWHALFSCYSRVSGLIDALLAAAYAAEDA